MADTREQKLVLSHESEGFQEKQKLQMKTFSELAESLARITPKITLCSLLFTITIQFRGMSSAFNV